MFVCVILNSEIFTYLKKKKYLILIVNSKKVNFFYLFTGAIHDVIVSGDLLVLY